MVRPPPGTTRIVTDTSPQDELADHEHTKDEEVLEREGLEQELMQEGVSEVGEHIEHVEDNG